LAANGTWDLVPLPAGRKAIGCCWVFRTKCNADGSVERYKARLVAQGFSQRPSFDYDLTFSPIVRFTTVCALLVTVALRNLHVQQMDVNSAFLTDISITKSTCVNLKVLSFPVKNPSFDTMSRLNVPLPVKFFYSPAVLSRGQVDVNQLLLSLPWRLR
jgi:hypothetical protein